MKQIVLPRERENTEIAILLAEVRSLRQKVKNLEHENSQLRKKLHKEE